MAPKRKAKSVSSSTSQSTTRGKDQGTQDSDNESIASNTSTGSRRSARLSRRTLSNSSSNEVSMSLDESEGSNNNSKVGSQKRGKTTRKKDEDINADQKEEENMEDKERGTTRKTIGGTGKEGSLKRGSKRSTKEVSMEIITEEKEEETAQVEEISIKKRKKDNETVREDKIMREKDIVDMKTSKDSNNNNIEKGPSKKTSVQAEAELASIKRISRQPISRYSYATVCSSNMNRSMEAHVALSNKKCKVSSYGTGRCVRLPIKTGKRNESKIFAFGTPYADIFRDLMSGTPGDIQFYKSMRILDMLKRNHSMKDFPQRWQNISNLELQKINVVICFEFRVFSSVIEDLCQNRDNFLNYNMIVDREGDEETWGKVHPIHVINIETKDDPINAKISGEIAVRLSEAFENATNLEIEAARMVQAIEVKENKQLLYQLCYL